MRRSTFYIFWLIAVSVIGAEDFGSRYQAIMANEDGAGENVRLKRLFDTRWQYLMTEYPEFATESGFVGQNDRWIVAESLTHRIPVWTADTAIRDLVNAIGERHEVVEPVFIG